MEIYWLILCDVTQKKRAYKYFTNCLGESKKWLGVKIRKIGFLSNWFHFDSSKKSYLCHIFVEQPLQVAFGLDIAYVCERVDPKLHHNSKCMNPGWGSLSYLSKSPLRVTDESLTCPQWAPNKSLMSPPPPSESLMSPQCSLWWNFFVADVQRNTFCCTLTNRSPPAAGLLSIRCTVTALNTRWCPSATDRLLIRCLRH